MLEAFFRILALTRKELLQIFKDPRSRYSLLIPPILQCLIYGYVATYDLNDVPYAVLDQDRSAASQKLLAALDGSGVFHRVANLERAADVRRTIDERRALLVLQIHQDFERRLMSGQPADLQVIADGRNSNTAGTAIGYIGTIIESFNTAWRNERGQPGAPVRLTTRAWYNPNLETRWHMIPALIGTLTFVQTLMLTGLSVAREREQGTFDQLLVTPFRPVEIMAGKAMPAMFVGIVQATLGVARGAALVSHSIRRLVHHAVRGLERVSTRGGRHGPAVIVGGRHHAAGDAAVIFIDHAFCAAVGADDSRQQHAGISPVCDADQSIALRDRYRPPGLSRRSGFGFVSPRVVAPGGYRFGDVKWRVLDVSPSTRLARGSIIDEKELESYVHELNSEME